VIKAEQHLPGTEGERERGWERGQEGEMTQTIYAHVNKLIIKIFWTTTKINKNVKK
jgi:hypothetical protein